MSETMRLEKVRALWEHDDEYELRGVRLPYIAMGAMSEGRGESIHDAVCWWCGAPDPERVFKACERCSVPRYCSSECQREDWSAGWHKQSCITKAKLPATKQGKLDRNRAADVVAAAQDRIDTLVADTSEQERARIGEGSSSKF